MENSKTADCEIQNLLGLFFCFFSHCPVYRQKPENFGMQLKVEGTTEW